MVRTGVCKTGKKYDEWGLKTDSSCSCGEPQQDLDRIRKTLPLIIHVTKNDLKNATPSANHGSQSGLTRYDDDNDDNNNS